MKFFLIAAAISFIILSADALMPKEKAMEMAKEVLLVCKDEEGGTDADIETMLNLKYPDNRAGNCMIACAHEKMGIFKEGVFHKDNFLMLVKMVTEDDPMYMSLGDELAGKCGGIGGERCDQALAYDKCIEDMLMEKHIDVHLL